MHSYYGGPISQSPVAQQVLLNRRQRQCPILLESTVSVPRPLGVRFVENRHRSRDSLNLTVVHELQPSGELATSTPQLQLGMVLSRIGGDSVVGQQHAAVMDALQARPLRLTFVDSLHKVMRVVTDGDLRAAYEYAMSVRNAHGGGGGGGSDGDDDDSNGGEQPGAAPTSGRLRKRTQRANYRDDDSESSSGAEGAGRGGKRRRKKRTHDSVRCMPSRLPSSSPGTRGDRVPSANWHRTTTARLMGWIMKGSRATTTHQ
jgi:hypothetical protein